MIGGKIPYLSSLVPDVQDVAAAREKDAPKWMCF
jgi:hypothetical protein